MVIAPLPSDEMQRIEELQAYRILDTLPEQAYDDLARIAAQISNTPIALVSLVDTNRQFFKAHHGLNACESGRDESFCSHALLEPDILIVEDAREDERFFDNPFVTEGVEGKKIRFYAGAPLVTSNGHTVGTLCTISDEPGTLSEDQKESLRALARQTVAQLELRRQLEEKRAEAEARAEAERVAEEANRAKSHFLANMSHEIRTPLTAIIGFADQLTAGHAQSEVERDQWVRMIANSGRHLLTLINDVLDLSKVEAGKMTYERLATDPTELLREVIATLRTKADEQGLKLRLNHEGPLPKTVETDPCRLRQALTNLVGNAIKFTQQGEVCLTTRLAPIEPNDTPASNDLEADADLPWSTHRLAIDVTDTGKGIPTDRLEAIFQPFDQADAATHRNHGGTGLGLTISRKIARGLGGDLRATSAQGQGSTFTLTIGAGDLTGAELLDPDASDFSASHAADATHQPARFTGRVLVVDDAPTNQVLLPTMLRTLGLESEVVGDGQQAVDRLTSNADDQPAIDLVLLDMQMPVMDGFTAAKTLRDRGFASPIIALTANAMKGDRDACLAAGCSDYLTKPIEPAKLTAMMCQNLANPGEERAVA